MHYFVTGASGWIGSATLPHLLAAGHEVTGLARSDASAEALIAAGAKVRRGDLEDLDALRAGASESDGVIHLGFIHDFSQFERNILIDRAAIQTLGAALEGSGRPLIIAGGTGALCPGKVSSEADFADASSPIHGRAENERILLELADRGVRSATVRLPPTVHGEGDHGFISILAGIARDKGVSAYVGDGSGRWPATHRSDIGRLYAVAVDKVPAGTVLHGVAEEGVALGAIAEVIGRKLGLPIESISAEAAPEHFGFLAMLLGIDIASSSPRTRELLGWEPTGPTLLEDLEAGYYTS